MAPGRGPASLSRLRATGGRAHAGRRGEYARVGAAAARGGPRRRRVRRRIVCPGILRTGHPAPARAALRAAHVSRQDAGAGESGIRRLQAAAAAPEHRLSARAGRRAALAESFSTFPWRHLNVANFLYAVADRDLDRRLVETDNALLGADRSTGASAVATGPVMAFASDAEMVAYLVDLWQRGSRLLDGVARLGGARYYHFLQPNQYVPGSKPISVSEAAVASNAAYRQIGASGHSLLQKAGRALATDGIRFIDLSRVFADHPEPLYVDSCCHVDVRGNTIVADAIFETIR